MSTFAISFKGKILSGDATVTAETQAKALVTLQKKLKKLGIKELYIYEAELRRLSIEDLPFVPK
jgi:hypothetical protein